MTLIKKRIKRINNYCGSKDKKLKLTIDKNNNVFYGETECEVLTVSEFIEIETETITSCYFDEITRHLERESPVSNSDILEAFYGDEYDRRKRAKKYIEHLWEIDSSILLNNLINIDGTAYIEGNNSYGFKIFANIYVLRIN